MPIEPTVFTQVMNFLPLSSFRRCVAHYNGNRKVQSFTCMNQFLCLTFAQLTYRESLRDIEICLRSVKPKLYHMGFRGRIARSTLADANEKRDWRICADFAQVLIAQARSLYQNEDFGVELDKTACALDSTIIDLCRSLLDVFAAQPGAFYIMDRGYVDFSRLYTMRTARAFFVTRVKRRMLYTRRSSRFVDKNTGLQCDQTIVLAGANSAKAYPETLRRIRYVVPETGRRLVFLANDFSLPAMDIARLYKARWRVELFFKWIKQHLRIKAFYGTSENAVKTQVCIAISVYVLVAIIKKRLGLDQSLYTILQVLSLSLFEKKPILPVFSDYDDIIDDTQPYKQLRLFDL